MKQYTIIKDTREQEGWFFHPEKKKTIEILGTKIDTLSTGDYSIEGYKDLIRVERKAGICELFTNMTPKANKERFEREMERLSIFPYKYMVIETSISKDMWAMSIPQFQFPVPVSRVFDWLLEIQEKYGVNIIFAGDCGEKIVKKIFERFVMKNA